MLLEKQPLSMEELESQSAIELPERDTLLVTIIINNVLNNNTVEITVRDVSVLVQVCANVLNTNPNLTCRQA